MSEETDKMSQFLETVPDKVTRNVKVATPQNTDVPFLLHISTNTKLKTFTPMIGRRQMPSEDRTVPRITVAPSLLGCFIGYAKADQDFMYGMGNKENKGFLGGFKIYGFKYDKALAPNEKLVPDAMESGEMWLVSYSAETTTYKPFDVGKAFYRSITYVGRDKSHPIGEGELYVQIDVAEGVIFSKNIFLKPGFHCITGPSNAYSSNWQQDEKFKAVEISKEEYYNAKNAVAALLGYTEPAPAYLGW